MEKPDKTRYRKLSRDLMHEGYVLSLPVDYYDGDTCSDGYSCQWTDYERCILSRIRMPSPNSVYIGLYIERTFSDSDKEIGCYSHRLFQCRCWSHHPLGRGGNLLGNIAVPPASSNFDARTRASLFDNSGRCGDHTVIETDILIHQFSCRCPILRSYFRPMSPVVVQGCRIRDRIHRRNLSEMTNTI